MPRAWPKTAMLGSQAATAEGFVSSETAGVVPVCRRLSDALRHVPKAKVARERERTTDAPVCVITVRVTRKDGAPGRPREQVGAT